MDSSTEPFRSSVNCGSSKPRNSFCFGHGTGSEVGFERSDSVLLMLLSCQLSPLSSENLKEGHLQTGSYKNLLW